MCVEMVVKEGLPLWYQNSRNTRGGGRFAPPPGQNSKERVGKEGLPLLPGVMVPKWQQMRGGFTPPSGVIVSKQW